MPNWTVEVVGESHANADGSSRQAELARCSVGEEVKLVPEPTNRFDPEALAVFSARGVQIGYLAKGAKAIRRRILAGNPVTAMIASIGSGSAGLYGCEVKVSDSGPPVPAAKAPAGSQHGGSTKQRRASGGGNSNPAGCLSIVALIVLVCGVGGLIA